VELSGLNIAVNEPYKRSSVKIEENILCSSKLLFQPLSSAHLSVFLRTDVQLGGDLVQG